MLRIPIYEDPNLLTFQLEGRLAGPWVQEATACWLRTLASRQKSKLRVDLSGVTVIDEAGKSFLAAAHARGAKLVACGGFMRSIVAEIAHSRIPTANLCNQTGTAST